MPAPKKLNVKLIGLMAVVLFISGYKASTNALDSGFASPPETVRTGCYWFWIDDYITEEGIVADLHAMKKAGITRAFIGLIDLKKIEFMSEQWWKLIHTALKTATELDIEIGMFNCPHWSTSGGPWIKPTQAMRYLAASQTHVSGPVRFNQQLAQPEKVDMRGIWDAMILDSYQDVKVLAFPVKTENIHNLIALPGVKITASDNIAISRQEGNASMRYQLPQGESSLTITLPDASPAQGLVVNNSGRFSTDGELQIREGDHYTTVKHFSVNRRNATASLGFQLHAPLVLSFPGVKTTGYRLVFRNTSCETESAVTGLSLTCAPVIEHYPEKNFGRMFNKYAPPWDAYMWEKQTDDASLSIDPHHVLDISKHMAADGTLTWDVPEGNWVILRTGMIPTGTCNSPVVEAGGGPEVDKIDAELVAMHYDAYLGEILRRIPAKDRKTWKVNIIDSYEKGGQNFTDNFFQIFTQRYGYDPMPYLPAYYGYPVGSPELSDRFLWDMRRLVADRISYEYVGTMRKKSHESGQTIWLENYGSWGFPGEFLQYGGQSDEVAGEFWAGSLSVIGEPEIRCATSCAHTYGKTNVWAESFTSGDRSYQRHPAALKQLGDWAFAEGVNAYILTVNIQQQSDGKFPGNDVWYNIEFNRKNTWFSQVDLFTTYARRCGFMLQQGLDIADVAYYIGEDAPKMGGVTNPPIPKGYHYDHINAEVLLRDATVKDGKLTLPHGTSYRVLVLPPQETMRPEILQKIVQLVNDGATVIGNPPERSPSLENYPAADKQVRELAAALWGETPEKQHTYGKGKIFTNTSLEEIFQMLNLPSDFQADEKAPVFYTHRRTADADIYFITNQSDKRIQLTPQFRVSGKQPELWEPVTAERRLLPAFVQNDATTAVPLQLEPSGSTFVVFRKPGKPKVTTQGIEALQANFPEPEVVSEVKSPWTVTFESDTVKRGPAQPVTFTELTDWSKNDNEQIRYFSGTAVYKTTAQVSKGRGSKLWLDLGKVGVMAKVKINGKYAGGVWTYPYRVEITPFVKAGQNEIEVETVNTWANRIIGDKMLPGAERKLHLSGIANRASVIQESGLLGPVKIIAVK